ncbi:conserved hypothetical protein [Gloeothece citriformis PCC 7424]|uniref:Uncharacterized protein n=1 Tax=Gloeothece citriformis (strain PCC 7424) TaxID=65393 RepID=B7KHF8_GLOC7|nr:hypothetical protein [Gloeothece citriformis]ACK70653.1 conserved hypothetical protein [Gloeothece citriformis PCC 7424]
MKISDLEKILVQIKEEQGDLPIVWRSRQKINVLFEEIHPHQLRVLTKTSEPKLLINF